MRGNKTTRLAPLIALLAASVATSVALGADATPAARGADATPAAQGADAPLDVFAAASLRDALHEIDALWVQAGHPAPRVSFAGSGALARQIQAGAPADVFLSADTKWMDALATAGLIAPGTRVTFAANALVLVEPAAGARPVTIAHGVRIDAVLGPDGRLAVGNTQSVPAGIYAAEALRSLGVWDSVSGRLAEAADVRAALLAVEHGAAPAAIVYRSDAHGVAGVAIAAVFPAGSHTPITYPGAVVAGAGQAAEARAYLALLRSAPAQAILAKDDFSPAPR